ncbi:MULTISPECIES: hypothetical protein [Rhizobium]|uniref:hypothetical protein n=1 Tax=Rhizobium TaxID=379 RepID=UPI001B32D2CF|nr:MULTISPECIES: hypothetical protein [Rhizobium]MBX4911217.1 hypothetical protein [Rhizobium bangladeshense]MBX5260334.1 hypothetical protein [Rhizobium sp. NLR16b]MBX5266424.1 hypothetical protein [Rhizobium sp. NLR16a]MBX5314992.1 hypothetical protein [Rhizobium sp. NLR11b]QTU98148.1 hypothetical protein J7U39_08310 [Rhizobium sp. NLR16a]
MNQVLKFITSLFMGTLQERFANAKMISDYVGMIIRLTAMVILTKFTQASLPSLGFEANAAASLSIMTVLYGICLLLLVSVMTVPYGIAETAIFKNSRRGIAGFFFFLMSGVIAVVFSYGMMGLAGMLAIAVMQGMK